MAMYRTISMSFWTDSKVVDDFTIEDRYFYLYLFTNPHTNLCGCYEISIKQMVSETGFNADVIAKLINRFVTDHDVVRYSSRTKEVLLKNWHKYNWTSSEKFRKPLLKEINDVKEEKFRVYLLRLYNGEEGYGIDTNCIDTSVTVTVTNTATDTDTITDNINNSNNKKKNSKNKQYTQEFEAFWASYPRRVGKGEAFKSFNKAIENGATLDTLIDGVEMYKRTRQWKKDGGAYIPNPATWLNQRRWEDSPEMRSASSSDPWASAVSRVMNEQTVSVKEIEANEYW